MNDSNHKNCIADIPQDVLVRETRGKRYIQRAGKNQTDQLPNECFRPIPNEKLDDVHKLKLHRIVQNEKKVRTIDLNKKPLPNVKMPAAKPLSTVKTEAEFYRNFHNLIFI